MRPSLVRDFHELVVRILVDIAQEVHEGDKLSPCCASRGAVRELLASLNDECKCSTEQNANSKTG